jgi:hypothetical protein
MICDPSQLRGATHIKESKGKIINLSSGKENYLFCPR